MIFALTILALTKLAFPVTRRLVIEVFCKEVVPLARRLVTLALAMFVVPDMVIPWEFTLMLLTSVPDPPIKIVLVTGFVPNERIPLPVVPVPVASMACTYTRFSCVCAIR